MPFSYDDVTNGLIVSLRQEIGEPTYEVTKT